MMCQVSIPTIAPKCASDGALWLILCDVMLSAVGSGTVAGHLWLQQLSKVCVPACTVNVRTSPLLQGLPLMQPSLFNMVEEN